MGYIASIETEHGDHLLIRNQDGKVRGGALAELIIGVAGYCIGHNGKSDERAVWFSRLNQYTSQPICDLLQPLLRAWYVDAGEESGLHIEWGNAEQLLKSVAKLKDALALASMPATLWYWPQITDTDLDLFLNTLRSVIQSGVTKVRIVVS